MRHDLLFGVGVLNYKVTGIARKKNSFNRPLATLPYLDHFGDVNEMILDAVATVETGQLGLLDNPLEIAIIAVAQYSCKFTT